eukprot:gene9254-1341_t
MSNLPPPPPFQKQSENQDLMDDLLSGPDTAQQAEETAELNGLTAGLHFDPTFGGRMPMKYEPVELVDPGDVPTELKKPHSGKFFDSTFGGRMPLHKMKSKKK